MVGLIFFKVRRRDILRDWLEQWVDWDGDCVSLMFVEISADNFNWRCGLLGGGGK